MNYLETLLWAYFVIFPIYANSTIKGEKQAVIEDPTKRIGIYRATMIWLWLPTLVLFSHLATHHVQASAIGVQWQWTMNNQIALAVIALLTGYFVISIKRLAASQSERDAIKSQFDDVSWLMPHTRKELKYAVFGVSPAAGICEELLFRGYLLALLSTYMPVYAAVILSSLAFGISHLYQGLFGALKTAGFGCIMSIAYLLTDSLVIAILIHTIVDIYACFIGYLIFNNRLSNE